MEDEFGIPLEFSNQLEKPTLKRGLKQLHESYRAGKLSWEQYRKKSEILEGKIKELSIEDYLVPELVFLSPDDAKNFRLKEMRKCKLKSKRS